MERLGSIPDGEVQRVTADVLARPEYAGRKVDEEAWLSFFERLRELFSGFQGWMLDLSIAAPLLYWTIIASLFLISVGLIAHMVWTVRVAMRAPTPVEPKRPGGRVRDLRAEAEVAAGSGRYLVASRLLYADCLEVLLQREVVTLSRGGTHRELHRQLARAGLSPALTRTFADSLGALERQLFRDREDDRELYRVWRRLAGEVRGIRAPSGAP